MALKSNEYITMVDVLSTAGAIPSQIINLTSQMNPMLSDAPAIACNMGAKHRVYVNKGLAKFVWGKAFQGVPTSKGRTDALEHTTGYIESAFESSCRTIDDIENYAQFAGMTGIAKKNAVGMERTKQFNIQQMHHAETLSQAIANALIYEDEKKNPNRITGFMAYLDSKGGPNASQIIDGGSTGGTDNSSMLMITWHPQTAHLIYPMGARSQGGMKIGPLQKLDRTDNDPNSDGRGGIYWVYRKEMEWHTGLAVNDKRYVARFGGIKTSNLSKAKEVVATGPEITAGADLIDGMTDMYYVHQGRRMTMGKTCIYANTTHVKYLDFQARNGQKNQWLFLNNTGANAKEVLTFRGVPIKESDALHNAESPIGA